MHNQFSSIGTSDWYQELSVPAATPDTKTYGSGSNAYNVTNQQITYGAFDESGRYYFRCVLRNNYANVILRVKISILNNADTEQVLEKSVVVGPNGGEKVFETIFKPNSDIQYNKIYFQIENIADVRGLSSFGLEIVKDDPADIDKKKNPILRKLTNKINNLGGSTQLARFGVQGPPLMWMAVNDQGIRVGRAGIFELMTDKLEMDFIGFMPDAGEVFLVDYTTRGKETK